MAKKKEPKKIACSSCSVDLTNAAEFWYGGKGIECTPCYEKGE